MLGVNVPSSHVTIGFLALVVVSYGMEQFEDFSCGKRFPQKILVVRVNVFKVVLDHEDLLS